MRHFHQIQKKIKFFMFKLHGLIHDKQIVVGFRGSGEGGGEH